MCINLQHISRKSYVEQQINSNILGNEGVKETHFCLLSLLLEKGKRNHLIPELGIYKRKQEGKQVNKKSTKKKRKKTRTRPRK